MAAAVLWWAWADFSRPSALTQDTTVILPRGSGFSKATEQLMAQQIIRHPWFFSAAALWRGDVARIKAGEYRFPAAVTPEIALRMLVQGEVVKHQITIPEGWNMREVLAALRADPVLTGELPAHVSEGSVLPETYQFTYGDTRRSVLERMQVAMQRTLEESWQKRAATLPLSTPEQALILASMVEKETGSAPERPRVAAVFYNRLRLGMKLQSDPTIVYGLEQLNQNQPLGRALTSADVKSQTAYNTYVIDGLPPTPIASPGKAAIEAVLHPLQTDELYFVATGTGGHHFATSLAEHEKNVSAYRQALKQK